MSPFVGCLKLRDGRQQHWLRVVLPVLLLVLQGTVVWAQSAQPVARLPLKFQIESGGEVLAPGPISLALPSRLNEHQQWTLVETTAAPHRVIPAQIDKHDPDTLHFRLTGDYPEHKTRSFEIQEGVPKSHSGSDVSDSRLAVDETPGHLLVRQGKTSLLKYNKGHVRPPEGIDPRFGRSAYIHPIWTLSGAVVTDEFPPDHAHQSGLFLAYTKATFEGRPTNFWELQSGKGFVRFQSVRQIAAGPASAMFEVTQEHIDATSGQEKVALHEVWNCRIWQPTSDSGTGYWIVDVESRKTAPNAPLQLPMYHYGGFAVRGARGWDKQHARFQTSEGLDRIVGNHTRPNWVDLSGPARMDATDSASAGITIMTHPQNFRYPEPARLHPTMPYFVFTPSQLGDWSITGTEPHISRYRCVIHDGLPDPKVLKEVWLNWSTAVRISLK